VSSPNGVGQRPDRYAGPYRGDHLRQWRAIFLLLSNIARQSFGIEHKILLKKMTGDFQVRIARSGDE